MLDGDGTTIVDAHRYTHQVRLSGIDVSELGQALGLTVEQSLSTPHHREDVVVTWQKVDRYARLVCSTGLIQLPLWLARTRERYGQVLHSLQARCSVAARGAESSAKAEALGFDGSRS